MNDYSEGREGLSGLSRAVEGVDRCYASWARANGVSLYRLKVLYHLVQEGPFTQKEFSERFGVPRQSLNNVIKQLSRDGLIELERGGAGRKEKKVILTRRGAEEAERIILPLFAAERAALGGMSRDEIDAAVAVLDGFSGRMRGLVQTGAIDSN